MDYEKTPDYAKLTFLLKKALLNSEQVPGGKYSTSQQRVSSDDSNDNSDSDSLEIPEELKAVETHLPSEKHNQINFGRVGQLDINLVEHNSN